MQLEFHHALLGTGVEDINVIEVKPMEWRDGSLGCPRAGVSYVQVITPGYLVVFEARGGRYEYHTDQQRNIVRCD
jgi:hypothetical protein